MCDNIYASKYNSVTLALSGTMKVWQSNPQNYLFIYLCLNQALERKQADSKREMNLLITPGCDSAVTFTLLTRSEQAQYKDLAMESEKLLYNWLNMIWNIHPFIFNIHFVLHWCWSLHNKHISVVSLSNWDWNIKCGCFVPTCSGWTSNSFNTWTLLAFLTHSCLQLDGIIRSHDHNNTNNVHVLIVDFSGFCHR